MFLTFIFGATDPPAARSAETFRHGRAAVAYFVAAAGVRLAIPMTWRWKLQTASGSISPLPRTGARPCRRKSRERPGAGVAVVDIASTTTAAEFLNTVDELRYARSATASIVGVYEDVADSGRFIETFSIESWLQVCISASGRPTPDEMLRSRVRQLLKAAPRVRSASPPSARTGIWRKRAGDPPGLERANQRERLRDAVVAF